MNINQASMSMHIHQTLLKCLSLNPISHGLPLLREILERYMIVFDKGLVDEYDCQQTLHLFSAMLYELEQLSRYDSSKTLNECYLYSLAGMIKHQKELILQEIELQKQRRAKNTLNFHQYVETIIKDYYKVLIVRVDLSYKKDQRHFVTINEFVNDIKRLRNLIKDKNSCFKHLLGYGIALEQGKEKDYHAHLYLIYNGSKTQNAWPRARLILEKWEKLTKYGTGFNCHTTEYLKTLQEADRRGIGMIHRNNPQEVKNALYVASYLTKPEKHPQTLLIRLPSMHTFMKGQYKPHGRQYQRKD